VSQSYAARYSNKAVDSILRIIGIEEGSTTTHEELKNYETLDKQTSRNRSSTNPQYTSSIYYKYTI